MAEGVDSPIQERAFTHCQTVDQTRGYSNIHGLSDPHGETVSQANSIQFLGSVGLHNTNDSHTHDRSCNSELVGISH